MLSSDLSAVFGVSDPVSRWVLPKTTSSSDLQRREKNPPSCNRGENPKIFQEIPFGGYSANETLCRSQERK